jgi:hypothetical protein
MPSALTLITFLTAGSLRAQSADSKAALAGVVQDPDAKAVVGAVVMSRNEQTGDTQTTTTDGRGHFTLAAQPGLHPEVVCRDWIAVATASATSRERRRAPLS